ncbi:MAG: D-alanine--D-alanine ligase [Syntrophobacterales bacterium]|nr:D-alanine--D-alanine ligase [Syntrophobacterales bacterium]
MSKIRVAILAGGFSAEREVSLSSGFQVSKALNPERYEVLMYDPAHDLVKLAQNAENIDVAMIMLHGRGGEDGTIQGFLEALGIPYQGSRVLGSAIAMNKIISKYLYIQAGLPVAPYMVCRIGDQPDEAIIRERIGFPLVVKPEQEGSSIGVTIVREPKELKEALEKAWSYDRQCLLEKYLPGREITVGVLGNSPPRALPPIEIRPSAGFEFFDYTAKYQAGATEEICPAPISENLTLKCQEYALRAHKALCCEDYSRTDMILHNGEFYILETNTIPGMTSTSLFPQAARVAGLSFSELLDTLIELAMEKRNKS